MSYPPPLAATLSGASVRQLGYWRRNIPGKGVLFEPEHGRRPRVLYSYRDVVALRMFVQLRGVLSLQKLRRVVSWLAEHNPDTHFSAYHVRALDGGKSAVWISPDGEYIDVIQQPGQVGIMVVMQEVFRTFTTNAGRWVPDLGEPARGVTINPDVRGGFPVIEGTRIPFNVVAGLSADGLTPEEIADLYPAVTPTDIQGAADLAELVASNSRHLAAA